MASIYDVASAGLAVLETAEVIALNNVLESTAAQKRANAWLDTLQTSATGYAMHITASLSVAILQNTLNPLVMQRNTEYLNTIKQNVTPTRQMAQSWEWSNQMFSMFLQPSLSGIPIVCQEEDSTRQIDVSEEPIIVEQAYESTQYVTDAAIPRPREWTLQGYLMPFDPLTTGLVIKPMIGLMRATLDMYAKSRKPVLFKTSDLTFKKVLITQFHWKYQSKVQNGLEVTVSVKEYCPATTMMGSTQSIIMELVNTEVS